MLKKIIDLITLKVLVGHRSQITALIGLGLNAMNSIGWTNFSPELLQSVNTCLVGLFGYFFSEKVSPK